MVSTAITTDPIYPRNENNEKGPICPHDTNNEKDPIYPHDVNNKKGPIYTDNESHDRRHDRPSQRPERVALICWTAGLGAVTAEAVAEHLGVSVASARGRLAAAEGERLLQRHHPLAGCPALYTVTRAGLRAAGVRGLDPCRVSAAGAMHLIECARVAAALERCYPDHRVQGERELRGEERESGRALASAELVGRVHGERSRFGPPRHRPDLVLWPTGPAGGLPVAVEVELTIKAPERLAAICLAWARARCVAGALYLAPPEVERAVQRAIDRAHAEERVVVVPLEALPMPSAGPSERTVPSSE
jgi:hypothetical protein